MDFGTGVGVKCIDEHLKEYANEIVLQKKWQGIVVDFDLQYLWMVTMFGKLLLNSLDIFAKVKFARFAEYGTDRT